MRKTIFGSRFFNTIYHVIGTLFVCHFNIMETVSKIVCSNCILDLVTYKISKHKVTQCRVLFDTAFIWLSRAFVFGVQPEIMVNKVNGFTVVCRQ